MNQLKSREDKFKKDHDLKRKHEFIDKSKYRSNYYEIV